jgi:competence protein ComEA
MLKKILVSLFISMPLWSAVDVNTATFDELVSLKGIGKKKASRIIEYREKHGCFKSKKEFLKIKGIKKKTFKKNKGNLIVGKCEK